MVGINYDGVNATARLEKEDPISYETISAILTQLKQQASRIEKLEATVAQGLARGTRFDVLTMVGVVVDFLCDEVSSNSRKTVEFNALPCRVTLDYTRSELSIMLEDNSNDVSFLGITLRVDCITDCHLLIGPEECGVVVDTDTVKISDVTQLTLAGPTREATRELYEALRDAMESRYRSPSVPRNRAGSSSCALISSVAEGQQGLSGLLPAVTAEVQVTPNRSGALGTASNTGSSPRMLLSNTMPCVAVDGTPIGHQGSGVAVPKS